jgi:hypothetical protein
MSKKQSLDPKQLPSIDDHHLEEDNHIHELEITQDLNKKKWCTKICSSCNCITNLPFGIRTIIYILFWNSLIMILPLIDLLITNIIDIPRIVQDDYNGNYTLAKIQGHWVQTFDINEFKSDRFVIDSLPFYTLGIWISLVVTSFFSVRWAVTVLPEILKYIFYKNFIKNNYFKYYF